MTTLKTSCLEVPNLLPNSIKIKEISSSKMSITFWLLSITTRHYRKVSPIQNWRSLFMVICPNAISNWTLSKTLLNKLKRHSRLMKPIWNAYPEKLKLLHFWVTIQRVLRFSLPVTRKALNANKTSRNSSTWLNKAKATTRILIIWVNHHNTFSIMQTRFASKILKAEVEESSLAKTFKKENLSLLKNQSPVLRLPRVVWLLIMTRQSKIQNLQDLPRNVFRLPS